MAQLAVDHERIGVLVSAARQALHDGDRAVARPVLDELATLLRAHDELEEGGIYPELIAAGLGSPALQADHEAVDAAIRRALADAPGAWADLPAALDRLTAHIATEEYDVFPAAHQVLSDPAWDRIERHRAGTAAPDGPLG